jgi:Rieske Fe-S protein
MSSGGACTSNAVGVGNASDVAMNGAVLHQTPAANVFICRDAGGLYAMDAGCTHLGCDVQPNNASDVTKGFRCPCHFASYDGNGQNPTSPAPRPLTHYQLCAEPSGALVVDPTELVAATVRLKA